MWSYQHQNFTVHQLPVLKDNYIYLVEVHKSEALIAIDPAVAVAVRQACKVLGKQLTHICNTHHHWDHTDGNRELKNDFGCQIIGAALDANRIPAIDIHVSATTPAEIEGVSIQVINVPGHTLGHIAFLIDDALFCGDTLFGAGCGRLFEGSAAQMWNSLGKLAALDGQTRVYCAHEYTMANLAFAQGVDPDNIALSERIQHDGLLRQQSLPTIPSTMATELATNPMLRPLNADFCLAYAADNGLPLHDGKSVFTAIRCQKDHF